MRGKEKPIFPHRLAGIEAEEKRLDAEGARRKRIAVARTRVARIVSPEHVDVAAMSLLLLEEVKGPGNVSRSMLLERCRQSYPESFSREAP